MEISPIEPVKKPEDDNVIDIDKINTDKHVKTLLYWQTHPYEWKKEFIPEFKHTRQQKEADLLLGEFVRAKIKFRSGEKLDNRETELAFKKGISIMSGHETGKDAWLATTGLWFSYCFPWSKIIGTAPGQRQLNEILWGEISKWMRKSLKIGDNDDPVLEQAFNWKKEKIDRIIDGRNYGKEWFMTARVTNVKGSAAEQADTISGYNAPAKMYMVDEAQGVPDPVYIPLEGALSGDINLIIIIFNPTRDKGYAIDTQYKNREFWLPLRWSQEDCERIDKKDIAEKERIYGRDDPFFRVRVLGLPPLPGSNVFIKDDWVHDAINRDIDVTGMPRILSVDCGAGGDKSVLIVWQGDKIEKIISVSTPDTTILIDKITDCQSEYNIDVTCIESTGIGKPIYDTCKRLGVFRVVSVDVRTTARDKDVYLNTRAELAWKVRDKFEKGHISIPENPKLEEQLLVMRSKPNLSGKNQLLSKDDIKRAIGYSCDEFDALCVRYYINDNMYIKTEYSEEKDKHKKKYRNKPEYNKYNFLKL